MKFHDNEATHFFLDEIPEVDSNHHFLAVISFDFALNKEGNYYLQSVFKIMQIH